MGNIRKSNVHQKTTNQTPSKRGGKPTSNKELTERQHEDSKYQDLQYRELVNNMSSAVAVYQAVRSGEDFIFKDFNHAGERIEKVRREDIIGKSVREVFPGVQKFGILEVFQRVWRTGRPEHFPIAQYKDERVAGWRDNYVYKLPTGEIVAIYDDVTERRQAEEALHISETKYKALFELAPIAVTVSDKAGNILESNKEAERLLGLSREEQARRRIDGKEWRIIRLDGSPMPADEYPSVKAMKENRLVENVEMGIVKEQGEITWINVTAMPIPLEGYGVVITYHDVTERKGVVEALRESEEKYRNVVERANDGICIIQDNIVKYVNARLGEIWGGPAEEIVNKPFTDYIHPDELPRIIDRYNRRMAGEQVPQVYETVLRHKDGSKVDTELNVGMITYRGKPAELVLIRDITERKQIEEELIAERDKLQIVTSNIGVGLAVISRDYRTLWANNVLTELFGETVGKMCYSAYSKQPSVCPWCGVQIVFEKGEDRVETEAYGFDKNGKAIWSQIIATPIRDKEGKVISALEVVVPITERKQAEEKLRESEGRYRLLFENMLNGLAYCETIFENNELQDFIYLGVNDAFEQLTGLRNVIGKRVTEVIPGIRESNPELFDIYGRVALTGEPERFETYLDTLGIWLSISVYSQEKRYFIAVFDNVTERKKAEDERKQSYEKLRGTLAAAVEAIATIAETRDPYTAGHQKGVAKLACAIAEEMGLSEEKIADIQTGATLHDIGKMYVPAEILSKPVKLNQLEFSMIKTHPQVGYDIVKKIEFPCAVAKMALQHHERLDGSGYPRGLSGDNILLEAKILAVADVIEAMASHRPYRPALGIDKALEEISKNKGKLYDPDVVDACVRLFNEKGFKFE